MKELYPERGSGRRVLIHIILYQGHVVISFCHTLRTRKDQMKIGPQVWEKKFVE